MDEITIRLTVSTDRVGSKTTRDIKFNREDWLDMTDAEKDLEMQDELWNVISWGYEEID